jgi:hypothetical protein
MVSNTALAGLFGKNKLPSAAAYFRRLQRRLRKTNDTTVFPDP